MNANTVRAAVFVASIFALYMSVAMLIPAAVDLYFNNPDWKAFALSAFFLSGLSSAVAMATRVPTPAINSRFGFLLVNLLWLSMIVAGAFPFLASSLELGFADTVFETVSAITATGATVLTGLDDMPPGLLLWRSILQWIGGLGVIALGVFLLPFLKLGGVSFFRIESSDKEDKPFARFSTYAVSIISIYALLTLICAVAYALAGMPLFHAVNHAMTTMATGGFSTHDASMGFYTSPAIIWTSTIFMTIGGLPFAVLILFAVRGRRDVFFDPQIRVFLGLIVLFSVTNAIWITVTDRIPFFFALTHSTFNFVSIITTTGYSSTDYGAWGPYTVATIFVAMFLGGCSGSTTGGIKAYRFYILFQVFSNGLKRLIYPSTILPVKYGSRPVEEQTQRAVVLFIAAFFVIWGVLIVLLSATGLDFETAVTGALSAITNVGPGLGDVIGPTGNFSSLSDIAKYIMAAGMLLGRLEILAVLILFTPAFWRR
ncbi:TrkH family potassium uptake protein [Zhengella sp. ZM62]|uniref:TrkH family potassium uptake protein n=1 Tax=Zhengella sedimenti TaxID=3390035 RepID=UPI00397511AE